jgi:hypothetical protein
MANDNARSFMQRVYDSEINASLGVQQHIGAGVWRMSGKSLSPKMRIATKYKGFSQCRPSPHNGRSAVNPDPWPKGVTRSRALRHNRLPIRLLLADNCCPLK